MELEKTCDCVKATASGPRIVMVEEPLGRTVWKALARMVPMACDKCDAPWITRGVRASNG